MKVLIVGYGYVGSAVGSVFNKKNLIVIDPKYSRLMIEDIKNKKIDITFVCVDTPSEDNFKTLYKVLDKLNNTLPSGSVVCCKSTAPPYFYFKAQKTFSNIELVHSPEFLSKNTNFKDFKNQKFLIFGGKKTACKKVATVLKRQLRLVKNIHITDIETAALIKYAENAFLAYKVTFFNDLYDIHKKLKLRSSFKTLVEGLTLDTRIGKSHSQVPGHDGKRGWGGHCLEKDNLEFVKFSGSKLMEFIRKINKQHRIK